MDFKRPQIVIPPEKEFVIFHIKEKIKELSRDDLESYLLESAQLLMKLTAQTWALKDYIEELEGKLLGEL